MDKLQASTATEKKIRLTLLDEAQDYPTHGASARTEACVFIECDADPGQSLEEIKFVEEQAQRDPRVRAIVAHAPLERGRAIEPMLEESVRCSSKLRGIRRILQSEVDVRALLQNSKFIEGVRLLRKFDLHFEITVTHRQMDCVAEFVQSLPEIPMVLIASSTEAIGPCAFRQRRSRAG